MKIDKNNINIFFFSINSIIFYKNILYNKIYITLTHISLSRGGDILAFDVVKKITDTEKEGEEIIKKAQQKAAEILKKSQDEAESIIEGAKNKADDYYKSTISKYEKEAEAASKPIIKESQSTRMKLDSIPAELMNSAVNMVIERIVNSHGDS